MDTGPIVAILEKPDADHEVCVEQLQRAPGPLLTCWPVITEAAWLVRAEPPVLAALLTSVSGNPFNILPLTEADLSGIAAILTKYEALGIQLADAALLRLAIRERIDTIFTLDRRDFSVLRMPHRKRLHLIP